MRNRSSEPEGGPPRGCEDYQRTISKLIDGEIGPTESADLFAHLAQCPSCRDFYHDLQQVSSSLDRLADAVPEHTIREFRAPNFQPLLRPQTFWGRQVPVRLPVLALLVCAILASVFMSFTAETVYVTKLPATTVTAQLSPINPGK